MVFNISVILWQSSVLLLEETGVPRENHQPAASHTSYVKNMISFNIWKFNQTNMG